MNGKIIALSLAITAHLALLSLPLPQEKHHPESKETSKPISIRLNHPPSIREKAIVVPIIKKPAPKILRSKPIHKKKTVLSNIQKVQIDTPKKIKQAKPSQAPIKIQKIPNKKIVRPRSIASDKPIINKTAKSAKVKIPQISNEVIQKRIPSENIQIQKMVKPIYPRLARRQNREGTVQLKVEVLKNGRIAEIKLYQSSGSNDMDASAIQAIKKWQFKPATRNGIPIRHAAVIPLTFTLE